MMTLTFVLMLIGLVFWFARMYPSKYEDGFGVAGLILYFGGAVGEIIWWLYAHIYVSIR